MVPSRKERLQDIYKRRSEFWSKVEGVGSYVQSQMALDENRAIELVALLENQYQYLHQVDEATIQSQFQISREAILELTARVYMRMQTKNIFHHFVLTTQDDAVYFSKYAPNKETKNVDITMVRQRFNCRPHPYTSRFSISDTIRNLNLSLSIGSKEEMVQTVMADEIAREYDMANIRVAIRAASSNKIEKFSDPLEMFTIASHMFNDTGRGQVTRIVCGSHVLTKFRANRRWVNDTSMNRVGGVYLAGTFYDAEVYTCLDIDPNLSLFIYRDPNEVDLGIAFGLWYPFAASLNYPERGVPCSVRDTIIANPQFIRVGILVRSRYRIINWILDQKDKWIGKYRRWKFNRQFEKAGLPNGEIPIYD